MVGLAEIGDAAHDWDDAARRFRFPEVDHYNIAADCLHADPAAPAILVAAGTEVQSVTFGELDAESAKVAACLLSLGCTPGDRVAIKLSQSVEMAVCVLAALRAGLVVVPLSSVIGDDGVRHRLTNSVPRVLIAEGSARDVELADLVDATLIATAPSSTARRLVDVLAGPAPARPVMEPTGPDSPALLMYTSGTTGKPKGVLHGHRVLLGHHAVDYALDHVRPDDVAYSPVDWAWAGGMLLGLLVPLAHGIPVVAYRHPRFVPEKIIELLRVCRVSVGLFPPTALRLLRDSGLLTGAVVGSLRIRCLVTGAEAVEPELADWVEQVLDATLNNAYGQTEANALIGHSTRLGALDRDALGRPYPGHAIAVLDDALQPVPAGVAGQIAVRADDPVCMLGYWKAEEATAAKVRDGWLLTGDTAHVDERGQFHFHGRNDDIIKSGGYRLGPAEIEAAVLAHSAVADCAVVGLPDSARGEVVTAYVRLHDGVRPDDGLARALQDQVRARVGAHAYPREVVFVPTLPRTTTGKVDRGRLRADAVAERAAAAGSR